MVSMTLLACAPLDSSEWQALEEAEQRWTARAIRNYEFETEVYCFCSPEAREARRVEVRDGVVSVVEWTSAWWAEHPTTEVPPPEGLTVEELFAQIRRKAESEWTCEMDVEYDQDFGVPLRISTRGPSDVTDTAWGRRVRAFRVLE
jgi:hypothetical protein